MEVPVLASHGQQATMATRSGGAAKDRTPPSKKEIKASMASQILDLSPEVAQRTKGPKLEEGMDHPHAWDQAAAVRNVFAPAGGRPGSAGEGERPERGGARSPEREAAASAAAASAAAFAPAAGAAKDRLKTEREHYPQHPGGANTPKGQLASELRRRK